MSEQVKVSAGGDPGGGGRAGEVEVERTSPSLLGEAVIASGGRGREERGGEGDNREGGPRFTVIFPAITRPQNPKNVCTEGGGREGGRWRVGVQVSPLIRWRGLMCQLHGVKVSAAAIWIFIQGRGSWGVYVRGGLS